MREEASVTIPGLLEEGEVALRLVPLGAHASPSVSQSLRVTCPDGLTARTEEPDWFFCSLSGKGSRTITVSVDALYTPQQLGINEDPRLLGVSLHEVQLRAE